MRSPEGGDKSARLRCRIGVFFILFALVRGQAVAKGSAVSPATAAASGALVDPATGAVTGVSIDETLLLDVQVNGHSLGKVGEFTLRHGKLLARPSELRDLGFRFPDSLAPGPDGLIPLSGIAGLSWTIDQDNQVLRVTASDSSLQPTVLLPNRREASEARRTIESGTGVTLNYDVVDTYAGGQMGATGAMDLRAFSPLGVASTGWLAYAGVSTGGSGTHTPIRLDSAYTFSDVNSLRRFVVGDFVTSGVSWARPVHLEGVQVRSDFSMRPDLVTFPLPSVRGSAAVPSTVDILADGNLMASSQIAAGPFETRQLPVMSGAGTISMTVTNELGQQVTVTQPFYASSALLAPGLQSFAGQLGLVRRNWGSASYGYGKIAGSAMYRRGLTPKFTVEGSAEGTPGAVVAGAGGVVQVRSLGVINFSAAASNGSEHIGGQVSVGAQRIGRVFSVGALATFADRDYRDVASINGAGITRKQLSSFASLSLRRYGSGGIAYAEVDQEASAASVQAGSILAAGRSRVVSANFSLQVRRLSIYASEFRDFSRTGNRNGLQIGLTIPLGRRTSASVSATSDPTGQMQVQKSATQIGEWGYDAYLSTGSSDHEFGQVQYKSPVGLFAAGIDRSAAQTTLRMESQGAISVVDRGVFPSNTIYDSFAIVDTGGLAHVHVLQENRDVGDTGSSGRLLVPDLRSFDLNQITIEPNDVPADATIGDASRAIRPQDRSGVVVKFSIRFSHGALVRLVDEGGTPLMLGSTATLRATGKAYPVGYDGEAYVEDLSLRNELVVERTDGLRCTAAFDYRAVPGDIPSIGPLRCLEQKP